MSWFTTFFPAPKPQDSHPQPPSRTLSRAGSTRETSGAQVRAPTAQPHASTSQPVDIPKAVEVVEPEPTPSTIQDPKTKALLDDGGINASTTPILIERKAAHSPEDGSDASDAESEASTAQGGGAHTNPFARPTPDFPKRSDSSDLDPFLPPETPLDTEHPLGPEDPHSDPEEIGDEGQMDYSALLRDVALGREVVVSHPGSSQYTQGMSVSACGLAALNCVRVILGKERDYGITGEDLLRCMMLPETIEDIVTICQMWTSQAHLDVDDIHQMPLFEESLSLHLTHFGRPSALEFSRLLSDMQEIASSAALVITRPPEILACFKISVLVCDVFVTFDSHPRPLHPYGAGFVFSTSLEATAQRLAALLGVDGEILNDPDMDWQAQLLGNFSGHLFTISDEHRIKTLEAAKAKLLEMGISALQLKTEISDLKTQINDLNQTRAHLEGRVETRDRMLGDLRIRLDSVAEERDYLNNMIQNGWTDNNGDRENQTAIIESLQAENERLQKDLDNKAQEGNRLESAKVASLQEEVDRLKRQLQEQSEQIQDQAKEYEMLTSKLQELASPPPQPNLSTPIDYPPLPAPMNVDPPLERQSPTLNDHDEQPPASSQSVRLPPPEPSPRSDAKGKGRVVPAPIPRWGNFDAQESNSIPPFTSKSLYATRRPVDPLAPSLTVDDSGWWNYSQAANPPAASAITYPPQPSWPASPPKRESPTPTQTDWFTGMGKSASPPESRTDSTISKSPPKERRIRVEPKPAPAQLPSPPARRVVKSASIAHSAPSFSIYPDASEAPNPRRFRVGKDSDGVGAPSGSGSSSKKREGVHIPPMPRAIPPLPKYPRPSPAIHRAARSPPPRAFTSPAFGFHSPTGHQEADLDRDRALAEQLQRQWNVEDPETAREIERVLREDFDADEDDWVARRMRRGREPSPVRIPQFPVIEQEFTPIIPPELSYQDSFGGGAGAGPSNNKSGKGRDSDSDLWRSQTLPTGSSSKRVPVPSSQSVDLWDPDALASSATEPSQPSYTKTRNQRRVYDWMENLAKNQARELQSVASAERGPSPAPGSSSQRTWVADEEGESRALAESLKQTTFDCGVCLETLPVEDVAYMEGCDHSFCRDCMRGYVTSKIKERRFPIYCPVCVADKNSSQHGVADDVLVQLVGIEEQDYEIYVELQLVQFSVIVHCRRCRRSAFVDREEHQEETVIFCPLPDCSYRWCRVCDQEVARHIMSTAHSCDGSTELNALMREQGWKRCPGCDVPVQKNGGCNHMTCVAPGCNAHFCYTCGTLICRGGTRREIDNALQRHYAQNCTLFQVPAE